MNLDFDPAPRLPVSAGERLLVWVLALSFFGLLLADLARGFSANKLSVLFVLSFWVPLLLLHELGHALAARSVGWRVSEVVIGFGRELRRFQIGHTRVRIRALPVEGYVVPSPSSVAHGRRKQAWIYLGGPLAELLLLGVVGWLLDWNMPGTSESVGGIALESLAVAAALGVVSTLLPYRSGGNPSDGLGIVMSWLATEESFRERLCWPFLSEARRLLLREQTALALETLQMGLQHYPDDPQLRGLLGVCQAAAGDAARGFATLEELGSPDLRPAGARADLLADAAWAVLFSGDADLLPDAQRALLVALSLAPDDAHYGILLGRVYLERGRAQEAYACLMNAYKRTRDVDQEAQCVAYLALACESLVGLPDTAKIAAYADRFASAVESHDVPPGLRELVRGHGRRTD
jgi:peptidase M50-like protein